MSKIINRSKIFSKNSTGLTSVQAGSGITIDNTDPSNPIIINSGGSASSITVVANYSAILALPPVSGEFYWAENPQGTKWLPGSLGGTYYGKGIYYYNGVTLEPIDTPYQATQVDVDAGVITDQFVSPATLNGWATSGPGGQTAFFTWKYSTNPAAADPGSGFFRGNNISAPSVTQLYIDDITSGNQVDISNLFAKVKGQWLLHIQQRNDATKWMQFTTAVPYTDNTGWWTLPVTFVQAGGGGSLTNLTDCLFTFVNQNDTPSSQGNTGALTYGGMTAASTTTVNIGALTGWVVDNETTPGVPVQTYINYPGASGVTVPTIASGPLSYLSFTPDGFGSATLTWSNTIPTSAQRKTAIYASKASHPNLTTLGVVGNETDYITSPLFLARDFFQGFPYINKGIHPAASAANLTFATSTGKIIGDGINFYLSRTNPNEISRTGTSITNFFYRTQLGGSTGIVSNIDPTMYDVGGVITAIPGGVNVSTIQYIYAIPFNGAIGFVTQYGQTLYTNLANARAAVGKEEPIVFPNLVNDAILVGFLAVRQGATNLTDLTQAQFFKADMFGQAAGGAGGTSVSTMQQSYTNSGVVTSQIVTTLANDGVKYQLGSEVGQANTDLLLVGKNQAGTNIWTVNGNGAVVSTQETTPLLIGGTAVGSSAEIRATSGVGVGAEFIKFTYGSNGASESMRIKGDGFVGIGTNNPGALLEVNKSQDNITNVLTLNAGTGTFSSSAYRIGQDSSTKYTLINYYNSTWVAGANTALFSASGLIGTASGATGGLAICAGAGDMRFLMGGFVTATNEKMRLDSTGNLSVGGTSLGSNYPLTLKGSINNGLYFGVQNASTGTTASSGGVFFNSAGDALYFYMTSTGFTGAARVGVLQSDGSGGLRIMATHASGTIGYYSGGATLRWTIGTAGHLLGSAGINIDTDTSTGMKIWSSASMKGAFFGATPIVQPASANQAAVTTTVATTAATNVTPYGYTTQAQADDLITEVGQLKVLVNQLRTELVALGLIKGSA